MRKKLFVVAMVLLTCGCQTYAEKQTEDYHLPPIKEQSTFAEVAFSQLDNFSIDLKDIHYYTMYKTIENDVFGYTLTMSMQAYNHGSFRAIYACQSPRIYDIWTKDLGVPYQAVVQGASGSSFRNGAILIIAFFPVSP